jgi:hypothetical protein
VNGSEKTEDSPNLGNWPCREAEPAAIDTARAHIDSARLLYAHSQRAQAYFFAMTAIELIGPTAEGRVGRRGVGKDRLLTVETPVSNGPQSAVPAPITRACRSGSGTPAD